MTLAEMNCVDSIGLPKFVERQARAMVQMVQRTGKLVSEPPKCTGRGIVIAGGGKYLSWAWVACRWLRKLGCELPIIVAHMGEREMPPWAIPMFHKLRATTWDAYREMKNHPVRQMSGWLLKNYAITHTPWKDVLFLDADCFPFQNPEPLFAEIQDTGGLFFSDMANHRPHDWGFNYCGLMSPATEWEAGQYLVNKELGWMGLRWANWLNEHADVWFKTGHGDKHTLQLGFLVSKVPHLLSISNEWRKWGIAQQWKGQDWFAHAMGYKRNEFGPPFPEIGHYFEEWRTLKR